MPGLQSEMYGKTMRLNEKSKQKVSQNEKKMDEEPQIKVKNDRVLSLVEAVF